MQLFLFLFLQNQRLQQKLLLKSLFEFPVFVVFLLDYCFQSCFQNLHSLCLMLRELLFGELHFRLRLPTMNCLKMNLRHLHRLLLRQIEPDKDYKALHNQRQFLLGFGFHHHKSLQVTLL